ncbi:hypothetical protein D3C76_1377560 [compost metagenome]
MTAVFFDIVDMHFVDEAVLTFCGHLRLGRVCFVGPNVVLIQSVEHRLQASLNLRIIVTGTEARQQELQHEGRDVGTFLDSVQQILANYLAVERRCELLIQVIHDLHRVVCFQLNLAVDGISLRVQSLHLEFALELHLHFQSDLHLLTCLEGQRTRCRVYSTTSLRLTHNLALAVVRF